MARKKRKMTEINASSMADISFLLLIFFLVTTSMASDKGLSRRLPPPPQPNQEQKDQKIKERDIFIVKINGNNDLAIRYNGMQELTYTDVNTLRQKAKEFILNESNSENLPVLFDTTIVDFPGGAKTLKYTRDHVISVQNDVDTRYQAYLKVQNELVGAYNEIRNEKSREFFQKPYDELDEREQKMIQKIYPQKISEAEPKNYGGRK